MRLLTILVLFAAGFQSAAPPQFPLDTIKLPPGFAIEVYATGVDNARQMALGANGTLFVGSRTARKVYAIVDRDKDNKADQVYTIATGLRSPSGITFRDGSLYVAEINRIIRYDGIESKLDAPPEPAVVNDKLPTEAHHGWKYLAFGPDGWLYVPVGAPCNVCERPDDERFATILRMKADGSALEVFARGIRNTVGFDWHPQSRELWLAENGRDNLGDDVPPDELLRAHKPGLHFGFPYCHGGDTPDPELGAKRACKEFEPPALKLGAHVAAIGMKFYTGRMFPAQYPEPDLRRRARLVEPLDAAGLPGHVGQGGGQQGGELHAVRGRLAAGNQAVAPARRPSATPGADRPTCWSCRTAPCLLPTTRRTLSIA